MYSSINEPIYPYIKVRKDFGRQPRFVRDRFRVHCNVLSNRMLRKKFSRFRLVNKGVQACKAFAETHMNTNRRVKADTGITHSEGGWPKDISPNEPDMMLRHRKKLEKEDNYQVCLPIMFERMQKYLKQNNAIDQYGELYKSKWKHRDPYRSLPQAKTILIYEDPSFAQRAVRKIIWAPENVGRMGVCHCPARFDSSLRETPTEAFFWDVENASRPESQVRSDSHIMDMMYHPKDMHSICGGCFDGTVQHWDARVGPNPVAITPLDICHTDICTSVSWINSKTNTEFFSAGFDGQVIWWDSRNLGERLETAVLDPEKGQARPEAALPATVLEYEQSVPTKYIAGAENGNVLVMMKKGKTPADRLINVYKAHRGPVLDIRRNPTFVKNFITVGDSTIKIFSEDCKDSPIMWTAPQDVLYTHAAWIPSRPSNFVATRNDGYFDIYDLLKNPARPYTQVKVRSNLDSKLKKPGKFRKETMQDVHLTYAAPSDAPSKLLAIGSSKGNVYMQKLSESLYLSEKSDKPILAQCFDRETRREKFIEQRYREIRLRKRDKEKMAELATKIDQERKEFAEKLAADAKAAGKEVQVPDYSKNNKYDLEYEARNDPIAKVEREFYEELERELQEKGIEAFAEYADAVNAGKQNEEETKNIEEALDVTAADLAAFAHVEEEEEEYDDDGRPISKKAPAPASKPEPPKEAGTTETSAATPSPVAAEGSPPPAEQAAPPPADSAPPPAVEDVPAPAAAIEQAPPPPPEEETPPPPEPDVAPMQPPEDDSAETETSGEEPEDTMAPSAPETETGDEEEEEGQGGE